ncbi:hypothetical protein PHPALM_29476, partial [Phytophthora palmivora]
MEVAGNELLALNDLLTGIQDARDDYDEVFYPCGLEGFSSLVQSVRSVRRTRKRFGPWMKFLATTKTMHLIPEYAPSTDIHTLFLQFLLLIPIYFRFEVLYKQSVMTEDVFLGLSDKDPSSAHCEAMAVRVECPNHRLEDIELDVKRQKLLLLSSTLKLALHLPHPVRHLEGQAKWDHKSQFLSTSLPIIRDECGQIFQDPQCLDCKHNFCRSCILLHLKQNNSHCPMCQLPTRPSEVTRNQFLESILAAWKTVETELEALHGDPTLHATKITVEDTDKALHRAASGAGASAVSDDSQQERQKPRGRVANNKWHIDTQEIRQELKLEQPYLPQHYGSRQGNTAHWKKTSSSDLPDDYGGSSDQRRPRNGHRREQSAVSLDEASAVDDETSDGDSRAEEVKDAEQGSTTNSLMATQEVESYLDRITKQREALSQWERNNQGLSDGKSSLMDLKRSLHSSNGF